MTSNLTLAQKLQAKSAEQAEILQAAQDSALLKLNESMTKSLSESESIIKAAMDSLNLTSERLSQSQKRLLQQMQSSTEQTMQQHQAHLDQQLSKQRESANAVMSKHSQQIAHMTQQHNDSIKTILSTQSKPYLIMMLVATLIIMAIGILLGLFIAKMF